jgi:RNA polymerase sigma-70 factor (ECF subfamily)
LVDDAEVIAASVADGERFGEIFERHYDVIARYARQRVGDTAGDDVASRTFTIAFSRRDRFDPTARSARPWLYGIATNLIRHHVRDERTHYAARGKLPVPRFEPDPNDDVSRLDAQRLSGALRDALLALSSGDRDVVLLQVLGGLTYGEIAAALEIPAGTVKSRLHRARNQLREHITEVAGIRNWMTETNEEDADG